MVTVVSVEEQEELTAKKRTVNKKAQKRILNALRDRDLDKFKALLQENVDVNYKYDEIYEETLLINACKSAEEKCAEFVELLLNAGADPNIADNQQDTALHMAAKWNNERLMQLLLTNKHSKVNVNALNSSGCTPLNMTFTLHWENVEIESQKRCIRMLMEHEDMQFNLPNYWGNTPLWLAQEQPSHLAQQLLQVLLQCGKDRIDVDIFHLRNGGTMREVIRKRFPKLLSLLPKDREHMPSRDPLMEILISPNPNYENFQKLLNRENFDINERFGNPYYCTCLELACRRKDLPERFLEALIENGANIEVRPEKDYPQKLFCSALHQATSISNHKALRVLVKGLKQEVLNIQNYFGYTALHIAAQKQCSPEEESDMEKCVDILLGRTGHPIETDPELSSQEQCDEQQSIVPIDVNLLDDWNDSALHDAAYGANNYIVKALLDCGADMMLQNIDGKRPIDSIDRETLEHFLNDQCESIFETKSNKDFEVVMKYTSLNCKGSQYEMATIYHISCSMEHRELLQHPIIMNFLDLKWHLVRWLFYIQLTIFVLFCTCFTAYIFLINSDSTNTSIICDIPGKQEYSRINETSCLKILNIKRNASNENCTLTRAPEIHFAAFSISFQEWSVYGLRISCILLLTLLAFLEIIQCIPDWKRYFRDWENSFEICTVALCAISFSYDWKGNSVEIHVSGIAILLTWMELVLFSGRVPILSIQLEMLKKVTLTFFQFMVWYSLLLVAFAFSFYIVFGRTRNNDNEDNENLFQYPDMSILKIVIMMVGELNASYSMFNRAPGTSHIIFLIFVFLIVIILLNLLNGLAVSDTQAIKNDAKILSIVSRVKLLSYLEIMLVAIGSKCFPRDFFDKRIEPMINVFGRSRKVKKSLLNIKTRKVWSIKEHDVRFEKLQINYEIVTDLKKLFVENKKSDIDEVKQLLMQMQKKLHVLEKDQISYHLRKSSI